MMFRRMRFPTELLTRTPSPLLPEMRLPSPSFGPPTRLTVSASPPELLTEGAGTGTELSRRLVLDPAVPAGVLQVVAQAATCDADAEHAACHLTRQDWGVPVRLVAAGAARLPLVLRGLDAPDAFDAPEAFDAPDALEAPDAPDVR